jgi:hypothetical protein
MYAILRDSTHEAPESARSVLELEVRLLLGPLMNYPSRFIGAGEVTTFDLTCPDQDGEHG